MIGKEISSLDKNTLPALLRKLLYLECKENGIIPKQLDVSSNIDAPDGAFDGIIEWNSEPRKTLFLPLEKIIFQSKATNLIPSKCKNEFLKKGKLKVGLDQKFIQGFAYILFTNKSAAGEGKEKRIAGFKEAFESSGKNEYVDSIFIDVYDQDRIAKWVNHYLPAVVWVKKEVGHNIGLPLITCEEWGNEIEKDFSFVLKPPISIDFKKISDNLTIKGSITRITGLSGLGKTRLAYEAIIHASVNTGFCEAVVYYDAKRGITDLLNEMRHWNREGISTTIVVDNCEEKDHNDLVNIVKSSGKKLQLISIDYEKQSSQIEDGISIQLEPLNKEIIQEILKQGHPEINDLNIERISSFAQGYPRMAVLIGKASFKDCHDISQIIPKELIKRLIEGRGHVDLISQHVLSICSIFQKIGFFEDLANQGKFVATNVGKMDYDEFYRIVNGFISRGIIIRRQRYIQVAPLTSGHIFSFRMVARLFTSSITRVDGT